LIKWLIRLSCDVRFCSLSMEGMMIHFDLKKPKRMHWLYLLLNIENKLHPEI
jgi:hypothetical protein